MKQIKTQIVLSSIRSKVDRSLSLSMSTPELSVPEKAIFLELQNIPCEMTLTPIDEKVEEYKVQKDLDQKTPSQRQRSIIYVIWEKQKSQNPEEPFSIFYEKMMERIATGLKKKYLDDEMY